MKTRRLIAPIFASIVLIGLMGFPVLAAEAASGGEPTSTLLSRLWRFTGIFHPMVVHFPVALLTLAAIVEALRLRYRNSISGDVTLVCLIIAGCSAVASAIVGWARAPMFDENGLLFSHRWLGIGLTVLTLILIGIAIASRRRPGSVVLRRTETAGVFAAAGMVALVGHLGAELTHGESFVSSAWAVVLNPPKPQPAIVEAAPVHPVIPEIKPPVTPKVPLETISPSSIKPAPTVVTPPGTIFAGGQPVDFLTQVWPIFQKHCVECHGPKKAKAKLRLDAESFVMGWDKDGQKLWVRGKSAESYILKVIGRNVDDDSRMPPLDSNKIVTPEEYDLIKRWIDEGASWPTLPGSGPAVSLQ